MIDLRTSQLFVKIHPSIPRLLGEHHQALALKCACCLYIEKC